MQPYNLLSAANTNPALPETMFLDERPSPIRNRLSPKHAEIRPISRISFEITDKAAFSEAIKLGIKWMEDRAQTKLPSRAWSGESFDVTDVLGANPAKAIRIKAPDGDFWSARLDFPDPIWPRTWVSEIFAQRQLGNYVRFGIQLTCVIRSACPTPVITRPTIIRDILEALSVEADGQPLSETGTIIDTNDVSELESLLYSSSRQLPVVVISENENGETFIDTRLVARQISGAAHVIHLTHEASWALTRLIGKQMSVFKGATRIYMPGLTEENQNCFQHPLFFNEPLNQKTFLRTLQTRLLPFAFSHSTNSDDFPRFANIRELASRATTSQNIPISKVDRLKSELKAIESLNSSIKEERDIWQGIAQERQDEALRLSEALEKLKDENKRIDAKATALEHCLSNSQHASLPTLTTQQGLSSYEDLEEWAAGTLGTHIIIHPAALKDCRKNGHNNMLNKIEAALLIIRDYLVPWRIQGGLEKKDALKEKLAEIGMEDTKCFVNRDEAKRAAGYTIILNNKEYVLFDHLKYGVGCDNSNQIRIYYCWDEQAKKLVVGKMPSHLPNHLTN